MILDSRIHIKTKEAQELAEKVKAWLSNGNKIYQAEIGQTGQKHLLKYGYNNLKRTIEKNGEITDN